MTLNFHKANTLTFGSVIASFAEIRHVCHTGGMQKPKKHRASPKRFREPDVNQLAHHLVRMSAAGVATPTPTTPHPFEFPTNLSEYMAAIGQRGGRIGGKKRLITMTDQERHDIASRAAKARWNRAKQQ